MYGGGGAQYKQNIENIGANGVSQGKIAFPFFGGYHRGHQFGKRGAQRNDRQNDKRFAPPECERNRGSAVYD